MSRVVCRAVCSMLVAIAACLWGATAHADDLSSEKTLRIHLTARNPHARSVSGPLIRFYAPIATADHELIKVDVNQPYQIEMDAYGNRAIVMQLPDFAPYSTRPISLSFTVRYVARNSTLISLPAAYRTAEPLIESTHPEIVVASQLLAGSTPLEIAGSAQQWVVGALNYAGYQSSEIGALAALRAKRGDCTEYAYLFAALMRARGIPARVLGGYVMPSSRIVKPLEYHNWAEFYADGKWNIADPQRNVFMKDAADYIATRIVVREKNTVELSYPHRFSADSSEIVLVME